MPDASRTVGTAECPKCWNEVELVEDGDFDDHEPGGIAWSGCAQGVCCDTLIADWWEGTFAFDLSQQNDASKQTASARPNTRTEGQ